MDGVDVLAVILRHADSHRQNAGSDAYSAQEAPKLERAYSAVAELIEAFERMISTGIDERTYREYMSQKDHYARVALRRVKGGE